MGLIATFVNQIASIIKTNQHYNDPDLISLWQRGDEKAFDCLYARYVLYLTNIALKKTTSIDIAKECVQDVFISLYHKKNELQTTTSLKAYLFIALQNKIYNHYQKQLNRIKHEKSAGNALEIVEHDLGEQYDSKILVQQIHQKINELPPKCRKVFLMSRDDQFSYKEIAEQLNISVNTVDQHIQKALRILRNSFGKMLMIIFWINILHILRVLFPVYFTPMF